MIRFTILRNTKTSLLSTSNICLSFAQVSTSSLIWSNTLNSTVITKNPIVLAPKRHVHDGKHFFTTPHQQQQTKLGETEEGTRRNIKEEDLKSIGQAITHQRNKRRKQIWSAVFGGIFGVIIGYSVIYKVIYLKEQS